jgi:hypothetical protein
MVRVVQREQMSGNRFCCEKEPAEEWGVVVLRETNLLR